MELTIITPNNKILDFAIEDWAPISRRKQLTEVMLCLLEEKHSMLLRHTLEYYLIKVEMGTDFSLILNKPNKLKSEPWNDTILLDYS